MINKFCKYIGLILIVTGAIILIIGFLCHNIENKILTSIALTSIIIGLITYIFLHKYIK